MQICCGRVRSCPLTPIMLLLLQGGFSQWEREALPTASGPDYAANASLLIRDEVEVLTQKVWVRPGSAESVGMGWLVWKNLRMRRVPFHLPPLGWEVIVLAPTQ